MCRENIARGFRLLLHNVNYVVITMNNDHRNYNIIDCESQVIKVFIAFCFRKRSAKGLVKAEKAQQNTKKRPLETT